MFSMYVALVTQHIKCMHRFYCHLWPALLYHIFPHYLITGKIFVKKVTEHKMGFNFLFDFC